MKIGDIEVGKEYAACRYQSKTADLRLRQSQKVRVIEFASVAAAAYSRRTVRGVKVEVLNDALDDFWAWPKGDVLHLRARDLIAPWPDIAAKISALRDEYLDAKRIASINAAAYDELEAGHLVGVPHQHSSYAGGRISIEPRYLLSILERPTKRSDDA